MSSLSKALKLILEESDKHDADHQPHIFEVKLQVMLIFHELQTFVQYMLVHQTQKEETLHFYLVHIEIGTLHTYHVPQM